MVNHRKAAADILRVWVPQKRPCQEVIPPELVVRSRGAPRIRIGSPGPVPNHPALVFALVVYLGRERLGQRGLDADESRPIGRVVLNNRIEYVPSFR